MADSRDDFVIAIRYALLKKSAKQKFSLFFLISLSILTITLDNLSTPFILSTRAVLNDVVYKVSVFSSMPGKFITYLSHVKNKHYNIVNKNKILEKEIDVLKSDRYDSLFLRTDNKNLKQALNLGDITHDVGDEAVAARVIIDQESPYLRSLLINKGS